MPTNPFHSFPKVARCFLSERMYTLETMPAILERVDGKMVERGVCCDEGRNRTLEITNQEIARLSNFFLPSRERKSARLSRVALEMAR
jgi:hypothetical protein